MTGSAFSAPPQSDCPPASYCKKQKGTAWPRPCFCLLLFVHCSPITDSLPYSRKPQLREGHFPIAFTRRGKNGVIQSRGEWRKARFADSGGRRVAGHDVHVCLLRGHVHTCDPERVKVG